MLSFRFLFHFLTHYAIDHQDVFYSYVKYVPVQYELPLSRQNSQRLYRRIFHRTHNFRRLVVIQSNHFDVSFRRVDKIQVIRNPIVCQAVGRYRDVCHHGQRSYRFEMHVDVSVIEQNISISFQKSKAL